MMTPLRMWNNSHTLVTWSLTTTRSVSLSIVYPGPHPSSMSWGMSYVTLTFTLEQDARSLRHVLDHAWSMERQHGIQKKKRFRSWRPAGTNVFGQWLKEVGNGRSHQKTMSIGLCIPTWKLRVYCRSLLYVRKSWLNKCDTTAMYAGEKTQRQRKDWCSQNQRDRMSGVHGTRSQARWELMSANFWEWRNLDRSTGPSSTRWRPLQSDVCADWRTQQVTSKYRYTHYLRSYWTM